MFDGIVGHEKELEAIKQLVSSGRSHAMLFVGPTGVGKRTIARRLVSYIIKSEKLHTHPDVMTVFDDRSIAIDRIRELNSFISRKPQIADKRIALIERAHRMAPLAADALLKTLEEPRGDRLIILTARHASLLPETVVSRASVISFNTLNNKIISDWLSSKFPEQKQEDRDHILFASCGSLGLAHLLSTDPEARESAEKSFSSAKAILTSTAPAKMRFAAEQFIGIKENEKKRQTAQELFSAIERALHSTVKEARFGITAGRALQNARADLAHNVAPQAVLEHLLLSL